MPRKKTLLQKTLRMLNRCDMTHQELADATGLGRHWIASFRQGRIPNPGIKYVQILHDYFEKESKK